MRSTVDTPRELLEQLVTLHPGASRTTLRQMLAAGRVRVNGAVEKNARRTLQGGDIVDVAPRTSSHLLPSELSILHEDDQLIVVVKDAGLLTVSTEAEREKTAQSYLNGYLRRRGFRERIHVVHRLDRDTSGVLVFAKDFPTREKLKDLFSRHAIDRVYSAIVEGSVAQNAGTFRSHLREDPSTLSVSSIDDPEGGKLAVTHYSVLRRGARYSFVEVTLETGRKNQIRVHFSEAGHPIAGDRRYGAKSDPIGRLALHAELLGFVHPVTGKKMVFRAPVPDSFRSLRD
jgi:23S rRNA pseudouridine1911/1915/1917 synthase